MSDLRIHNIDESSFETVIAEDVQFEGEMMLTDPILIKGKIKGTVTSRSNLYISERAQMETHLDAMVVSIRGQVAGDVRAQKRWELFRMGKLRGKIFTPDLIIQSGSRFNGSCEMPEGEKNL